MHLEPLDSLKLQLFNTSAGGQGFKALSVTKKLALCGLLYHWPSVMGSVIGLVGLVTAYCDWLK